MSLGSLVGALALFVTVQIARAPRHAAAAFVAGDASGRLGDIASTSATTTRAGSPRDSEVSETLSTTGDVAPDRNLDEIRATIAAATNTYMSDMLVDLKHQIVRWPDKREQGLRVWVQSMSDIPGWDLRYAQMARDAIADWGGDGVPLRFDFILDSATADVRLVWLDRFPAAVGRRVGTTRRRNDHNGWLSEAEISVAVHDSAGATIRPEDLAGIVRHEAGHALGLGHSRDPKTKMYPIETVNDITPMDRATLRLLYQLPPGVLP